VRYVTHQFAHIETLERTKRWLIQAGFDPSRIEALTQGIPTLAVAVEGGESAEVQRIIDVAESSDPEGYPGIWELAHQQHVHAQTDEQATAGASAAVSASFVVGWRPLDADREVTQTDTEVTRQIDYREAKE
jgi:hypothetical protein